MRKGPHGVSRFRILFCEQVCRGRDVGRLAQGTQTAGDWRDGRRIERLPDGFFRSLPASVRSGNRRARAIIEAVQADKPPFRLALGRDANERIKAELDAQLLELDSWKQVALDADFPTG
jgi:hypothetical protein